MSPSQELFRTTPSKNYLARHNRPSKTDRSDRLFRYLMYAASGISVAILLLMGWTITGHALPAIKQFGWGFLVSQDWNVPDLKSAARSFGIAVDGAGFVYLTSPGTNQVVKLVEFRLQ